VKSVTSLRPENFDKVYEACRSLLAGEGAADVEQKPHVEQSLGKVVHFNETDRIRSTLGEREKAVSCRFPESCDK